MYSQCPECQTRFRVTAEVLRIAHGTVRCGRCGSAFDALSRLSDTLHELALPATLAEPATGLPPDLVPDTSSNGYRHPNGNSHPRDSGSATQFSEVHFSADDIERVFVDSRDWQRQFGAERHEVSGHDESTRKHEDKPGRGMPSLDDTGGDGPEVEVDETGTFEDFEDITLEGERIHIEGIPEHLLDADQRGARDDEDARSTSATDEHPLLDARMVEVELPEAPHSLLDEELLEAQAEAAAGELLSLDDAQLLDNQAAAQQGSATSLLDAEWLEAELEEALHALETEPKADSDPTGSVEVARHVPESAYPADVNTERAVADVTARAEPATGATGPEASPPLSDARPVSPQDPALPGIAPIAAVGHAAAVATAAVTNSSAMPSARGDAAGMTLPASAAPTRSTADRDAPWAGTRIGDLRPSARVESTVLDNDEEALEDGAVKRNAGLWALGALLLGIVLAGQLTHYFRLDLLRDPNFGPALRRIYERLDVPLEPNWNPGAYELRQWGASDTAPVGGSMTVRASIKNRAAYAQPLPLLRLDLEDRFGGLVATRDFKPREYLKDPTQATRMLEPNDAVEAQLALAETAPDAVGYKLDICVREGSRTLCAQADAK